MQTRGEGVKKSENFADVISGSSPSTRSRTAEAGRLTTDSLDEIIIQPHSPAIFSLDLLRYERIMRWSGGNRPKN